MAEKIKCPDCGVVEINADVFEDGIPVSGKCPKCGDRLYFATTKQPWREKWQEGETLAEFDVNDDGICELCGEDVGLSSHYHCPRCGKECSMMGHLNHKTGEWECPEMEQAKK